MDTHPKLKIDNHFVPCEVSDQDEYFQNGFFEFNITRMIKHIQEHQEDYSPCQVSVGEYPPCFSSINEGHVDSVDVTSPVILAEIAPGRYNLIDGHHRMEKARRLGLGANPAYILGPLQHTRFLTSQKAYEAYVGYWNDKLKELAVK